MRKKIKAADSALGGCAAAMVLAVGALLAQAPSPSIQISGLPAWGDPNGILSGRVTGLPEGEYKAAAFVIVESAGVYSKPTCASPTVPLVNSSFSIDTTGGVDAFADAFAVLIVPAATSVGCFISELGIPESLAKQAVASVVVLRPDPSRREIEWSGLTWVVKRSIDRVGPEHERQRQS
jgi:hypothetical protein